MRAETADRRGIDPAGAVTLVAVALVVAAATLRRIWATDFWWQYAAGAWIGRHGFPTHDVFSYTAADRRWIELHWLFEVLQQRLMDGVGPASLVLGKGLAVALAFGVVAWPWLRGRDRVAASAVLLVAVLGSSHRFFVRPELVTYVLLAVFAIVLDRFRREGGRAIWGLPLLQVVWVNCHPMALLGPLLVGLCGAVFCLELFPNPWRGSAGRAGALRKLRTTGAVFGLTLGAMLVNPYGLGAFEQPLLMFGEMRDSIFRVAIVELRSPFSFGLRLVALRGFWVLIGLCVVTGVANWRRLDPFWTILAAAQFCLAATSIRNLPLFSLAAVPFVLSNLERRGALAAFARSVWTRRLAAALVAATSLASAHGFVTDRSSVRQNDGTQAGFGIAEHRFPFRTAETLLQQPPGGRVFATLLEGSFLVARGVPVFADPRLEVYGEEIFAEFLAVQQDLDAFREMAERRDVRAALVGLRSPLAGRLLHAPRWRLVDFDTVAALYYRDDATSDRPAIADAAAFAATLAALRATLPPPLPWSAAGPFQRVSLPGPYLALSDFLIQAGQPAPAQALLDEARAASPFLSGVHRRQALLFEALGEPRGVVEAAVAALAEDPADHRTMARRGEAHFRLQEPDLARGWLERSLDGLPDRALTWSTLGRIHLDARDLPEAERCLARAVELAPDDAVYRANLARVIGLAGRTAEAIAGLEAAVGLDPGNVSFYRDLVQLHAMTGNRDAARAWLERGLLAAPDDPALLGLREALDAR